MKGINKLLAFAALAEVSTGVALLVVPSLVGRLLLGQEMAGVALIVGRVAGIALVALGIACWPTRDTRAYWGMLSYNALAALYLLYLGICGDSVGPLLWPSVALHAVLTLLLARSCLAKRKAGRVQQQSP